MTRTLRHWNDGVAAAGDLARGPEVVAAVRRRPALRVLLVSQPTDGGAAVCVRQLAGAAVAAGFDTVVACPEDKDLPGWVRDVGARFVELHMTREPGRSDPRALRRLRRLAADRDVVHLHASKAGALGRLAIATLGRRRPACVFTPHAWSWQSGGALAPAYRAFERAAVHLTDAIVAVSEDARQVAVPVLADAGGRVRVIENGIDLRRFSPAGSAAPRRGAPLIVSVGRLTAVKGQDVLVAALARVHDRNARLRLVGDGPERARLLALARACGVVDRVELVGSVADPAPHLRAADVVAVPSRRDALSLALLEAMACGAAIVATAVPGASALGGAGVIVPPEDEHALADAIDALLVSPVQRASLGRSAREVVESRYGIERSTEATLALWESLARARRRGARR